LSGVVDEVRVYERALSYDEILQLANQSASPTEPLNILYFGNSWLMQTPITYEFVIADIVAELAVSAGFLEPYRDGHLEDGWELGQHRYDAQSNQLIQEGNWDYVLMVDAGRPPISFIKKYSVL